MSAPVAPAPRRAVLGRAARCLSVSVGTTLLSAGLLVVLTWDHRVPAGVANVVAVTAGIGPSYFGNRRWAWGRTGRGSLRREVLPFWGLAVARLLASTVAVGRVDALGAAWSPTTRAVALPLAQLGVFAVLWLVQFGLLERVVFRGPADPPAPNPVPDRADLAA